MVRRIFVWLHRWTGLLLAGFLILEGLTGSLISFNTELTRLLNPQIFAKPPAPGAPVLDLATLAERAEAIIRPHAGVSYFSIGDGQVVVRCHPLKNPATGEPYVIGFKYIVLDPWTGDELGRLQDGHFSQGFVHNIMPFMYELHVNLALAAPGALTLGALAFIWTLDCFVGFYLTFPVAIGSFWRRWRPSWLIKRRAGFFRLNFDLHRASGLWLWPMLFVFAWSSVMLDLMPLYDWVTGAVFDYQSPMEWFTSSRHPVAAPRLDWRAAQTAGERLMAEQAAIQGFRVKAPLGLAYIKEFGVYSYDAQSDREFPEYGNVAIYLDGDSGALRQLLRPTGERSGNTVSSWLRSLHMIRDPVDSLAYRIFVCALGLAITMLSVTGVYIWWKKRRARIFSQKLSKAHRCATVAPAAETAAE